jgi:hypothetical protein
VVNEPHARQQLAVRQPARRQRRHLQQQMHVVAEIRDFTDK